MCFLAETHLGLKTSDWDRPPWQKASLSKERTRVKE